MVIGHPIIRRLRPRQRRLRRGELRTLRGLLQGQIVVVDLCGPIGRHRVIVRGLRQRYITRIGLDGVAVGELLDQVRLLRLGYFELQIGRVEGGQHVALLHPIANRHFDGLHRARCAKRQ